MSSLSICKKRLLCHLVSPESFLQRGLPLKPASASTEGRWRSIKDMSCQRKPYHLLLQSWWRCPGNQTQWRESHCEGALEAKEIPNWDWETHRSAHPTVWKYLNISQCMCWTTRFASMWISTNSWTSPSVMRWVQKITSLVANTVQ